MKLSIVSTLYRSEPYIKDFLARVTGAARAITDNYEIILVNDGSPDRSLAAALELRGPDPRITIIDLSRNFGHHHAIMAGLSRARGELVFLIDSDLEEDPELLERFWNAMASSPECDVVYGVQAKRKGGMGERLSGWLFYYLMDLISDERIPRNLVTCRLMRKQYVENLLTFRERELFLGGVFASVGFTQIPLSIEKHSRGSTSYTVFKRFALFINAITSFSNKPLALIFYSGICIFLLSCAAIVILVARKFFFSYTLAGWTSVMVVVFLMSGLIISFIGIVGIYLSKIFIEIKGRPAAIVRRIYSGSND